MAAKIPESHVKTAFGVGGAAGGLGGAAVQYAMVGALSPPMLGLSMLTGAFSAAGAEVAKPSKSTKEAVYKSAVVGGFVGGTTSAVCIKSRVLMSSEQKKGLLKALKKSSEYGKDSELYKTAFKKKAGSEYKAFLEKVVAKNPNATKDVVFTTVVAGANGVITYSTVDNMFADRNQREVINGGNVDIDSGEEQESGGEQQSNVVLDYNYFEGSLTRFMLKTDTNGVAKLHALDSASMRRVVGVYRAMSINNDSEMEIKDAISKMIELEMGRKNELRR